MARLREESFDCCWIETPKDGEAVGAPMVIDGLVGPGLRRYNGCIGHVVSVADDAHGGQVVFKLPEGYGGFSLSVSKHCVHKLPTNTSVLVRNGPFCQGYAQFSPERFAGKVGYVVGWDHNRPIYRVQFEDGQVVDLPSKCLYGCCPVWEFNFGMPAQWRRNAARTCTFVSSNCALHEFHLNLPVGFRCPEPGAAPRRWPLFIYLHGCGGKPFFSCNKKTLRTPGMQFVAKNFVVVSPVCKWRWDGNAEAWVSELVTALRGCCWIDHTRVYLSGCSQGGMSALEIAAGNPRIYSALMPVAGYHKEHYRDIIVTRLRDMPVHWWHPFVDDVCPANLEAPLWEAFAMQGNASFKVTMLSDANHYDAFHHAYCNGVGAYRWLLQHALVD